MDSGLWGIIIAVLGLLGSLATVAVSFGSLRARFEEKIAQLEKRADEDRCSDRAKFQKLYDSRNSMQSEIAETVATINALCDRLERIEPKLDALIAQGVRMRG